MSKPAILTRTFWHSVTNLPFVDVASTMGRIIDASGSPMLGGSTCARPAPIAPPTEGARTSPIESSGGATMGSGAMTSTIWDRGLAQIGLTVTGGANAQDNARTVASIVGARARRKRRTPIGKRWR